MQLQDLKSIMKCTMQARFHHWKKKKGKVIVTFLSQLLFFFHTINCKFTTHNSDLFYLVIKSGLRVIVRIVKYKLNKKKEKA